MNRPSANSHTQAPVTILVVDDDPDCRGLIRDALGVADIRCRLYEAAGGTEALEMLQRRGKFAAAARPDLIYLDVDMPDLSGCDVLKMLKDDPDLCNIPVVIMTGARDEDHRRRATSNGASGFFIKPTGLADFVELVTATVSELTGTGGLAGSRRPGQAEGWNSR